MTTILTFVAAVQRNFSFWSVHYLIQVPQESHKAVQDLNYCFSILIVMLSFVGYNETHLPALYFSSRSQMDLLEYGSTPEVGSSKITTFDPPTNAMATDSFLCMPPVGCVKNIPWRRESLSNTLSRGRNEWFTWEVLSLFVSLVRQPKVNQHVLNLPLRLHLSPTFQQWVKQDVLLHGETETHK